MTAPATTPEPGRLTPVKAAYANNGGRRAEPNEWYDEPDLVRYYMDRIGSTPLLTAEEEVDLAKRIEAGVFAAERLREIEERPDEDADEDLVRGLPLVAEDGDRAADHMIRANLRLVLSVAKRYLGRGLPFLDLIQEGNLGLIHAVEKFDYMKGYKFSTYAVWWIRQAIERALAQQTRTIRLPVHVVEELSELGKVDRALWQELGREPTVEEVAKRAKVAADRVVELRRAARETISLDTPVGEDGDTKVIDLIEDTDVLDGHELVEYHALAEELRAVIDTLPPREAMIITLRYGLNGRPHTLQEIADKMGYTRERIRQLERDAMAMLRDPERREPLLAWAG